jgi:hypothetical protein
MCRKVEGTSRLAVDRPAMSWKPAAIPMALPLAQAATPTSGDSKHLTLEQLARIRRGQSVFG